MNRFVNDGLNADQFPVPLINALVFLDRVVVGFKPRSIAAGMLAEEPSPVGCLPVQFFPSEFGHQSSTPGRSFLGTLEHRHGRRKYVCQQLSELGRFGYSAGQNEFGSRKSLPVENLTAESKVKHGRE